MMARMAPVHGRWTRRGMTAVLAAVIVSAGLGGIAAGGSQPPVHPLLPWHSAVLDDQGRLLPWYRPAAGLGYDHVLRLGWRFVERQVPIDPRRGAKAYLLYSVFDER